MLRLIPTLIFMICQAVATVDFKVKCHSLLNVVRYSLQVEVFPTSRYSTVDSRDVNAFCKLFRPVLKKEAPNDVELSFRQTQISSRIDTYYKRASTHACRHVRSKSDGRQAETRIFLIALVCSTNSTKILLSLLSPLSFSFSVFVSLATK